MPRMKILNSVEREVFDFPPIFNSVERKRCFDFPTPLQDIATSLRTASNQLVFLLSCGYFKATKRFYPVPTFHRRALTYVADRIAVTLEGIDLTDYPKQTMSRHQAAILNFYGFRAFKPYGRAVLGAEITRLVQSHLKPKLIFSRALDVLVRETGFSYAPRFKNLKRQRLYIFRSRQSVDRSAWKIKPAAYCDEQHIIQFWDDILRFIATIKLKETTASDIFRRLLWKLNRLR
jgi:hypothetical protein